MDYKHHFKGKKITLMGLGLLGRGVGDAKFLAECGAELVVTDIKEEKDLKESLEQLKDFKNITFALGGHRLEDFKHRDMIIKGTGVPTDSPFTAEAHKNKIPVHNSTALFCKISGSRVVGVTGTRGKSTVTHMLYEILKDNFGSKVFLGGNVRGVSTLSLLSEVKQDSIVVLELDSWQLQGFGEEKISPHVAVFTTFFPDHLNYYKNDMDVYLADKANIFKFQKREDFLILGEQVENLIVEKYGKDIKARIVVARGANLPVGLNLQVLGEHNRYNAACASEAAEVFGLTHDQIRTGLEKFTGVAGRLEFVRKVNGVKIYNDTTATTPEATIAALKALGKDKNIVLIMGGADKELDMEVLKKTIPQYTKSVVLLPGTGTDKFLLVTYNTQHVTNEKLLHATSYTLQNTPTVKVDNLKQAIDSAFRLSTPGDVILFSPAFASFGLFKNEFDRGDKFLEEVKKL